LKLIFFSNYRDVQYRIIALKKIIKTSIKLIKLLFIDIKRYSSFDRCNLLTTTCVGQGDQATGGSITILETRWKITNLLLGLCI